MVYKFEPWFSLHHPQAHPVSCIASVSLACGSRTLNPTRNSTGNVANAWDPGDTGGSQQFERMVVDQKACGVDRSHTFSLRMGWTLIIFDPIFDSKSTFSAQSGSGM